MKIDAAIDKLVGFKKIADAGIGECEIIGFDDDSFIMKVNFKNEGPRRKPVIGFGQSEQDAGREV